MRIVLDLQCCQTEARHRGIGRFTLNLTKKIIAQGKAHDFLILLNGKYMKPAGELVESLHGLVDPSQFLIFDYPSVETDPRAPREALAGILRSDRVLTTSPDLYHVSSHFEGESVWGPAPGPVSMPSMEYTLRSTTLFDCIPLIYPEHYLNHERVDSWYRRTSALVREFDIGLAISDATKADAIRYFGLPEKSVVNISGGVDDIFKPIELAPDKLSELKHRFKIKKPFVLYVGGPDFRKNLDGCLAGFAQANAKLNNKFDLVIVYSISGDEETRLRRMAQQLGIADNLVIAGYVSEADLVMLYSTCSLFVFPSLYEGLGLPVLEAMSCGAPVLVSNNSSLPELVAEKAYQFDPFDPSSIGTALERTLKQPQLLEEMKAFGLKRAKDFSWEKSAQIALDTWEDAYAARRKELSTQVSAPSKHLRMAYFSPLPPSKTGIASYSAELLPFLAKWFDIDVFVENSIDTEFFVPEVRVRQHDEFSALREGYDVVLFQLGNSPYHHYMLPYIDRVPGIVVIHDAFLGHLSNNPDNPDEFCRQVIEDHGSRGRNVLMQSADARQAARDAIRELTCSRTHVHKSIGVLVHSSFAKRLVEADSTLAMAPAVRVIPHIRELAPAPSRERMTEARTSFGISATDFVVGSFGHISYTKAILELIEAFNEFSRDRSDCKLLLVGELEGAEYGSEVRAAIAGSPRPDAITITGFVDDPTYHRYLRSVDVAVQLRSLTRGETSGAILYVFAYGVPLITNALGSTAEYPSDSAIFVPELSSSALAQALGRLRSDPGLRQQLSDASRRYLAAAHSGDAVARDIFNAAQEFRARVANSGPEQVRRLARTVLKEDVITEGLVGEFSRAYVNQEFSEREPRLFMDVTHIREGDLGTGVQRVVRELTRELYKFDRPKLRMHTTAFTTGGLMKAEDFAQRIGATHSSEPPVAGLESFDLLPFDRILMADGTWHLTDMMRPALEAIRNAGGSVFALVHDVLPLQHPDFFYEHVLTSCQNWLLLMLEHANGLICTSKAGADTLMEVMARHRYVVKPGLRIGFTHLGSDIPIPGDVHQFSDKVADAIQSPFFLMVSTIEPRKGHAYVLDAFEEFWRAGGTTALVIAGKPGWLSDELLTRIANHKESGTKLRYLGFISDYELQVLYSEAHGVIMASVAEGFGLPIFEAARHGRPLLLSDLPVFKEIAGEHATYFPRGDAKSLCKVLREQAALPREQMLSTAQKIKPPTWADCAKNVVSFMDGHTSYFTY